jgi:fructose-1,6-bisphosphatase/inositol monophosphatase family enzyme
LVRPEGCGILRAEVLNAAAVAALFARYGGSALRLIVVASGRDRAAIERRSRAIRDIAPAKPDKR